MNSCQELLTTLFNFRKVLLATTKFELKKRYAGSFIGTAWFFLYPLLFLGVYLFLYLLVFKVKYPELNTFESVIYIFSGLIPYIAFMEAVNNSTVCIKQNIHLVKNVILPIELIPIRNVLIAIVAQIVGFGIILLLSIINHSASFNLLYLLLAIFLETLFLLGLALLLAPLGLILPDLGYIMNILTLLLMFLSPIGFMAVMLADNLQFMVTFNPIYYLIQPFRLAYIPSLSLDWTVVTVSVTQSFLIFFVGCYFFNKFKEHLVDFE